MLFDKAAQDVRHVAVLLARLDFEGFALDGGQSDVRRSAFVRGMTRHKTDFYSTLRTMSSRVQTLGWTPPDMTAKFQQVLGARMKTLTRRVERASARVAAQAEAFNAHAAGCEND